MINYDFKNEAEKNNYLNGMVLDMCEALKDVYTDQVIEFITDAKRSNIRAWLNEEDTFHGNEWLLDSVITAMSNDANLRLVAKAEHIPIGTFLTAKENCLYQLQEMKLTLITLLSLKHAINEQIKNSVTEMILLTRQMDAKVQQDYKTQEAANDAHY
ncbi:hypothetical protein [Wohlfahrtiimonas chitiniclastica]|uniref:hypothetical protein n=1 Tax=Wohlfahrtiimonas chitiniclastica TaxID=400946 RepID=UPI002157C3D1|nr:hypothetical protein [Wohlfahrtiimonas chitiniclastica]MDC7252983.1 hypothetical protein [Wohlfahrtiimonas chitiniclastica]